MIFAQREQFLHEFLSGFSIVGSIGEVMYAQSFSRTAAGASPSVIGESFFSFVAPRGASNIFSILLPPSHINIIISYYSFSKILSEKLFEFL